MRYKSDWDMAKKRLTAYWNRDIVDRCCCAVYVYDTKKQNPLLRIVPGDDAARERHWTDPEAIIARNRDVMETTYYGGEAFPQIFVDLGAAGHAGFFKGAKHFYGDSMWFFPSLEDPDDLVFDEHSFLLNKTLELAKAFSEDSKSDYMVSMPDCTGNADALSHLMGPENLLPELIEEPEKVIPALKKIEYAYEYAMKRVYDIVKDNNEGGSCVGWLSTWAPGLHAQMQSDMSVMISNDMYKEFIMPELTAQCDFLEYPLYHFDGVEQIRHLDSLLSLDKLRAIQWTQVEGQKPATDYIPELQRIQAAGKNILILVSPKQIKPLMENLSSKGLYLITTANSVDEANAILKDVGKYTHE